MKDHKFITAALSGLASLSAAHFTTSHLLVNGTDTGNWKHVLKVAGANDYYTNNFAQLYPQHPYNGDTITQNITCGRNAFDSMDKTEVATVLAGEEIGFGVMKPHEIGIGYGKHYGTFGHLGAGQVWLSRAPKDDLKSYRGDGDWFQVAYGGPANATDWSLPGQSEFNFTLPKTTPPGKYLMRFEFVYPSPDPGAAQLFINCALVDIMGPGGGTTPTTFLRFPGSYTADDPGLRFDPYGKNLLEYKPFGGPVWTG